MPAKTSSSTEATFSVIGADVEITGDIAAKGDLHIDGAVKGNVSCKALVLGESGRVTGDIKTEDAKLSGTVEGNVDAATLNILSSARTKGDVRYDTLSVEAGAKTEGGFSHRGSGSSAGTGSEHMKLVAEAGE